MDMEESILGDMLKYFDITNIGGRWMVQDMHWLGGVNFFQTEEEAFDYAAMMYRKYIVENFLSTV